MRPRRLFPDLGAHITHGVQEKKEILQRYERSSRPNLGRER